jgi:uncharacterized protein YfaS (alpha-2-macroglobulin family)
MAASATTTTLPQATRPAAAKGTVVVPDAFLRRWDPVTIFFAGDTGPAQGGPEDQPARYVSFTPSHPGAFTWLDARTLQFKPASPWPPLACFTIKAGSTSAILNTLMAAPINTIPANGASGLDPVESITMTFPEPLDAEALSGMVSIELRPLPGIEGTSAQWLRAEDFQVKTMERGSPEEPAGYVLALRTPIRLETRAIVHLHLSLDDDPKHSFAEFDFRTAEPFRITAVGSRDQQYPVTPDGTRYTREQALDAGAGGNELVILFNAEPAPIGPVLGRNLVRFTPAVDSLSFKLFDRQLVASGHFTPETVYRATIVPAAVTDRKGRALILTGPSELYFYFPSLPSYLRWGARQGIVERFGPQMAPVEGRSDERVDLRIYKIDPLDRSFWPFTGGTKRQPVRREQWENEEESSPRAPSGPSIMVDEGVRPPGPGEEPETFNDTHGPIPGYEIQRRITALGAPALSKIVSLPLSPHGRAASFGLDLEPHLAYVSGKGSAGTYLAGIRRLNGSTTREWMRLQVTDLTLTTLEEPKAVRFVVTSLSTGRPVEGCRITVEGIASEGSLGSPRSEGPKAWDTLSEGTTDGDGAFVWTPPAGLPDRKAVIRRIVARTSDDLLVLDPNEAPDSYADSHWSPSRETWLEWAAQPLEERGPQPETLCHIFTERPVYRPEETVHIKGYLRRRAHGALSIQPMDLFLAIQGPGQLKWRFPVAQTERGSFYYAFAQEKLPTGDYSARVEDAKERVYGEVGFKLDAYRIPEFEVSLAAPDRTPLDKEFVVKLTADYYAGGRVAARPVEWRVTQFPYTWAPEARPGFLFSSDARFSRGGTFQSTPRLERQDTTDEEGTASLVLNPTIEPTAQPRTYVVEATVTGADDQTVTSMHRIIALPPFVLGLKVARYIERAEAITPEILVLGPDGKPLAGTPVTVRLLNRQWHSVLRESDFSSGEARYLTDVVDEKVSETIVQSGADAISVPLPISKAGVYIVELEAHDRLGRAQVVSVDLYAGGEGQVAWSKPSTLVFSVATDKESYDPGESAALVLESPFRQARALVIIEGPEGNEYSWLPVENGAATFHLPIRGIFTPRVPVHFVLMRGRIAESAPLPGSGTDLGKPATLASTVWVKVNPLDNRAEITLDCPEKARPGEKVEIVLHLRDPKGNPLSGEVTLWLVDQAVLALGKEQRLDPVPDFVTDVRSFLSLRDTRNLAFGHLPLAERPGGGEGAGEELLERATIRKLFQSVPYYNPEILVGPDGVATVTVTLPDNLTNLKIRAKAACGNERFGFATGMISVRLPLIVQPALPRFVRPGDHFQAAAIGRVIEGEGGPGSVEIRVEGATLQGEARRALTFTPNQPERISFDVDVPTPSYTKEGKPALTEAVFRVGVSRAADSATDAFEVRLPIREDVAAVTTRLMQDLAPGTPVPLPALTAAARPGTVRRSLLVSGQPGLVRMAAGLQFLLDYPYGCTEQRLSRARAALATKQFRALLYQEGGAEGIDPLVEQTLAWLPSAVDGDGLVAYWPGSPGYVSLTAWTVQFLVEARSAGFAVDPKLQDQLTHSLEQALRSDYARFVDGESYTERAWALAALTAAGKFDPSYGAELGRRAQFLSLEATAEIVQAFAMGGQASSPAVPPLLDRLSAGITTRLHQGREIYGGLQEGRTASGLILPSETRTLAEVTRALARTQGTNPRLALLTDALVTLGRDDGWGSTNADAAALLALSEQLRPPFTGAPSFSVTARLGGESKVLALGPETPAATWESQSAAAGEVSVSNAGGNRGGNGGGAANGPRGPAVLRFETSYVPLADGSQAAARAGGFVVAREILRIGGEDEAPARTSIDAPGKRFEFKIGDVVEEHIQVVNSADRNFVAVTVPLAAGFEILNPRLATASPEATPKGHLSLPPTYASYLDDAASFYYDALPKGTYDFYFRTRATVAGRFIQPPARAEMMYDLSVAGNSPGANVEVARPE